jgi:hypothetical protein
VGKMYRFQKQSDPYRDTTVILQDKIREIDGHYIHGMVEDYLYFSLPDEATIQDAEIEAIGSLPELEQNMYSVLTEPAIKDISPHYELVNKRVQEKIRSLYSLEDELKVQRLRETDPESFESYNQWCEECRAWGREQKALMGFTITE